MSLKLRAPARLVAALAVAVPLLAVAPAAGAATLIGSGSSAEQPIMRGCSPPTAGPHDVSFTYSADGGNAGIKDVQHGAASSRARLVPRSPATGTT